MNAPKYKIGDRFMENWVIIHVSHGKKIPIYKLCHSTSNSLMIIGENRIDDIFTPQGD